MFALVSASPRPDEGKYCDPVFALISRVVLESLNNHLRYQINCVLKLFHIAIMKVYAKMKLAYNEANPLLIAPHRMIPVMAFLRECISYIKILYLC